MKEGEWKIDDDSIKTIIRNYTRESGVRGLEREISKLTRKAVKEIVTRKKYYSRYERDQVENYLGVKKFKYGEIEQMTSRSSYGLAWTEVVEKYYLLKLSDAWKRKISNLQEN